MENRFILISDTGQATHPLTASNLSLLEKLIAAEDQRAWDENRQKNTPYTSSQPRVYTLESSEPSPARDPTGVSVCPRAKGPSRRKRKWLPLDKSQPTLLSGVLSAGHRSRGQWSYSNVVRKIGRRWLRHWKRRSPSPSEVMPSDYYSVTESQESGVGRGRGWYRRASVVAKNGSSDLTSEGTFLRFGKRRMLRKILGWIGV
ncbi:hypothetical protein L207DRAFT_636068 [Hyaloscypha variabilis F]|uniref:Uncharacterized protein n=1 Tax=Hyaloscypha variabilis (strain UAMH 11265 / GT02V1 / F) TaxID=1149755 RepID=A0A2J6RFR6_HYAVF|nr:hypothetical protein L207DRAFT_636068 [Hyaloscypha variabilis F]